MAERGFQATPLDVVFCAISESLEHLSDEKSDRIARAVLRALHEHMRQYHAQGGEAALVLHNDGKFTFETVSNMRSSASKQYRHTKPAGKKKIRAKRKKDEM